MKKYYMKKNHVLRFFIGGSVAAALLLAMVFQGCKKSDTAPVAPNPPAPVAPAITDFSPKNGLIGATVVITGTNFDSIPANNAVKFNGIAAMVTKATTTQLTVTVPQGAASGKISTTVNSLMATSTVDFIVNVPLALSTDTAILNQVIYLTGGPGFGIGSSNGFALYVSGVAHYGTVLGSTGDSLVFMVPYVQPGVYADSARVNGVMVSLGTFTVDTPALTQLVVVGNVTPGTAAVGATATITVGNGSNVAGSTTVSLVALYQQTNAPVSINCTVTALAPGLYGTNVISFSIPNGVVTGGEYAIKVTVNGVTSYGGLSQYFIGG